MKTYVGIFAELLTEFVAFKRSLDFNYDTVAKELYRFSKFSITFNTTELDLTKEMVQAWNTKRPNEGHRNNCRRVYTVRQFALYLNTKGYKVYFAPSDRNLRDYTFIPYIFTPDEIERILKNSDQLFPHRRSMMPSIMPVILRMLYSCGLRISEAVHLLNKHVNLQDGILEIKNSKFGKDRLVPMSETMTHICREYYQVIHKHSSIGDYFFMKTDRQPITCDSVYRRFREILWKSGISHGGKGSGPRLHETHIFCTLIKACSGTTNRCVLHFAYIVNLSGTCFH